MFRLWGTSISFWGSYLSKTNMALAYHLPRVFGRRCVPNFSRITSAGIVSKHNRDPDYKKPKPYPYQTKTLNWIQTFLYEGTMKRFDENTKVVLVEGNIGAGKSNFAKQLAEALDMHFFPEPTMDQWYITSYGYDTRELDPIAPPTYKTCDIKTFYTNPFHPNVAKFQMRMYALRLCQYIDGLTHLLNTGEGVVLERSVFSDFVFVEAMYAAGYIRKEVKDVYNLMRKNTLDELLKPHLIIYLDVSPDVALERIKQRNIPHEVNSEVLTKDYLDTIEHYYKQEYLKEFQKHSELMIYDWNNFGDTEVVIEDIERVDFDRYTRYDTQLKDWRNNDDFDWGVMRRRYLNEKHKILKYTLIFKPHVTELYHTNEDVLAYEEILNKIPGERFAKGYNPNAGDSVLFKLSNWGYAARSENKRV